MHKQPHNGNLNILAFSPTHSSSGKSFALGAMLKQLQEAKESGTFMLTDCHGEVLSSFRNRNFTVHTVVQSMEELCSLYASNNWLKMHGYPVRRKMINHKKKDRQLKRKRNKHSPNAPIIVKVGTDGTPYQVDELP